MGAGVLMSNRLVRRSLVVAVSSLSIVAVGCGVTGTGQGASGLVTSRIAPQAKQAAGIVDAAQTTGAVGTYKVAVRVQSDSKDGRRSSSLTSSGEIDAVAGRAHLAAQLPEGAGGGKDVGVETVYDGETVYLKAPFLAGLGVDKPWVAVTSPKLATIANEITGGIESDPGSFLALLEGAGGPVETVGTEDLRGVPTRHVKVQLDPAKVLDQASVEHRQRIEDQLQKRGMALDALAPLPAEAWIDDDGYVRRFSVSFDLAELSKAYPGTEERPAPALDDVITETIELYDFGEPVDIVVPPASEVSTVDLSELFPGEGD